MLISLIIAILIIALVWWLIQAVGIPAPVNIILLLLVVLLTFGGGYYGHHVALW